MAKEGRDLYQELFGLPDKDDPQRDEKIKNAVKGRFQAGLYDHFSYRWDVAGRATEEITKDWDAQKFEHAHEHGLTDEERRQWYSLAEKYQIAATGIGKQRIKPEDPTM